MIEYLVFAICALIFLVVTIFMIMPASKRETTIPGPDVIDDLEGHFPDINASGSIHEFLRDMHETYGKIIAFYFGRQMCVSLADPTLFKEQNNVFDRPALLFEMFEPLFTEHSIQYTNGVDGRTRHSAYSSCFRHDSMNNIMDQICELSKDFVKQWKKISKEEHIPLGQFMCAFAVKSVLQVAFGQYYTSNKEALEMKKNYDIVWHEMESRLTGDAPDSTREEIFDICVASMKKQLYTVYKQAQENKLPEAGHRRFIDELIALELPEDVVKADMMTMCVAGFHTTGLLLTWATYYLALHPDVQQKLYEELKLYLEDETITFEALSQIKYMRQVLDETLRCSQLAPYAARVQGIETELGGHKIPAGTPVVHALGVVLEDETIWPDPELFDPDRFSEENKKNIPSLAFQPFGFAGKRKCPGYRLAYFEATVLLSEILRKFKIHLVEGQVVQKTYGLVTKPHEEIWITLECRK